MERNHDWDRENGLGDTVSMLRNFGFAFFLAVPSPVTSELGPDATAVNPPGAPSKFVGLEFGAAGALRADMLRLTAMNRKYISLRYPCKA